MTEIPAHIMQIAADTLDNALCHDVEAYGGSYEDSRNAAISEVARALMSRDERAAKIADEAAGNLVVGELPHGVAIGIATAIRTHSEK